MPYRRKALLGQAIKSNPKYERPATSMMPYDQYSLYIPEPTPQCVTSDGFYRGAIACIPNGASAMISPSSSTAFYNSYWYSETPLETSPSELSSYAKSHPSSLDYHENFSFVSSESTSAPFDLNEYSTVDISAFASRSSSSRPHQAHPTTSYPYQCDSYYNEHRAPRHPSTTALTVQLETYALTNDSTRTSSPTTRGPIYNRTDMDTITPDEVFFDDPNTPPSDYDANFDHPPFDLSMRDLNAPWSIHPSLSLEAQSLSSYTQRRRQRQTLVRSQCTAKRAPDPAILIEECHPSSISLSSDPLWQAGTGSSSSSSTTSVSRVEKNRCASVRNMPRMRKRSVM